MTDTYADRIGGLIRDARKHRGLTQTQLADVLGTSQSAVHRIEAGNQNLSLDMVNRIAEALESPLMPKVFASWLKMWAISALRSNDFVGMHPTLLQTPPQYFSSMMAVDSPSWAARTAAT